MSFRVSDEVRGHIGVLRQAVDDRAVVSLRYADQTGVETTRTVRPLGLYFWGHTRTLAAWCDLRQAFRNFRLDRVQQAELTGEIFEHVSPVTLEEFIAATTTDRDT